MTESKKEADAENKDGKVEETSKKDGLIDNIEVDPIILKESEMDKEGDNLDDDNEVEYHRKSFHAREYKSETIELTQKEVEDYIVKQGRPLIRIRLSKKRNDFEKECMFHDKEGGDGDLPEKPKEANEMIKMLCESQIQSCHPMKEFTCQTYFNRKVPESVVVETSYFLGKKDEKEVKVERREAVTQIALDNEEEQKRKRVININKELETFLDRVAPLAEESLQSNEIINVFQDDFEMLGTDDSKSGGKLVTGLEKEADINPLLPNKKISCIRFDPTNENVVAIAYMDNLTFDERLNSTNQQMESSIVFWNFENKQNPHAELKLWSPVDITVFDMQPGNPNFVVAGAYNGQILIYNRGSDAQLMTATSEKEVKTIKYKAISTPDKSHHAPITDIRFLPVEIGLRRPGEKAPIAYNYFMTVGYDGQILIWDSKQDTKSKDLIQETPFNPDVTNSKHVTDQEGEELGLMNVCLDPDLKSKCFWSNTEDGDLVKVDFFAHAANNNHYDRIKTHYTDQKGFRPPVKLERSTFFANNLFVVYDYYFAIWSQENDKPLFHSSYTTDALNTCGALSPTRPGVLLIGRSDGKLELWDFLEQSNKPSCIIDLQIQTFLSALEFQVLDREKMKAAQYVAIGDGQGVARIFSVPKNFRVAGPGEESNMTALWRRQESRLKYMKERHIARNQQRLQEENLAEEEEEYQRREQMEDKSDDVEKRAQEKEELHYKLFLIKVKQEELHLITKEEAEVEKKAVKQEYKKKKRAS